MRAQLTLSKSCPEALAIHLKATVRASKIIASTRDNKLCIHIMGAHTRNGLVHYRKLCGGCPHQGLGGKPTLDTFYTWTLPRCKLGGIQ